MSTARKLLRAVAFAGVAGTGVGVACTGGPDKVTGSGLVSIVVAPDTATVVAGSMQRFTAQTLDVKGKPISGITVIWASADTSVATVTQSGTATALKPGTVQVAAAAQGVNGYATLTVIPVPVASVIVAPSAATIRLGLTSQLTDTLKDAQGNVLTGPTVTWASGDTTIVKMSQTGAATGRGVGTTQVTASAGGKSGSATVTVTLVPVALVKVAPATDTLVAAQHAALTALAFDSLGNALTGRIATWSSANPAVATVATNGGLLTGIAPGTTIVTATIEGKQGSALVTVVQPPVASIAISPHPASVTINGTTTLTATLHDARGDTLVNRTLTWKSSDTTTATVGSFTGQMETINGRKSGIVTITATSSDGPVGTDSVTVTDPVNHILMTTPSPFNLRVTYTAQATAQAFDVNNTLLPGVAFAWTSKSGGTIAQIDPVSGVVTGVIVGSDSIYATAQGQSAGTAVTILADPVNSVSIGGVQSITTVQTLQLTDTLKDSTGKVLTGIPVTWSSVPSGRVSASGLVTPQASDTTAGIQVTAAAQGKSATVTVPVGHDPVTSITVALSSTTVRTTYTVQATATAFDAAHNPVAGVTFAWSTNPGSFASVSNTGLVTGNAAGTDNVVATAEGVNGQAAVTVSADPVSTVIVAGQHSITYAQTEQLTDTLKDSTGKVLTGIPVTWSSVPAGRVSNVGLVTPQASDTVSGIQVTVTSQGKTGTVTVPVTHIPVVSITVTPNPLNVVTGYTHSAAAAAFDAGHNPIAGVTFTWSTTSGSGSASVDGSGTVTGGSPGGATLTASAEGVNGSATINVYTDSVSTVTVTGNNSINYSQTEQLTATLKDSTGRVFSGPAVSWSSVPSGRVNATGLVTPQPSDTTSGIQVTATSQGVSSVAVTVPVTHVPVASITVSPNPFNVRQGYTRQASATAFDAGHNPISGVTFTWSTTSGGSTASVNGSGVVTGTASGGDNLTAAAEGVNGSATVNVLVDSVSSVTVTGNNSINYSQTDQLTATLKDSNNKVLSGPAVTWSSVPSGRVNSSGLVTPQASDTTSGIQVTATSEAVSSSAVTVPVTHIAVSSITVTPNPIAVRVGYTRQASATAYDAGHNPISGVSFTWSTGSTGSTSSVSGSGVVTGVAVGGDNVTASAEGVNGSSTVNVLADSATSVSVGPSPDTIYASGANSSVPLTATQHDSTGKTTTSTLTWASTSGVATVSGSGNSATVTGANVGAGSTSITATAPGGVQGAATVIVLGHVQTVAVATSLDPADTLSVSATAPYPASGTATATLTDTFGNNVTSQRPVTWTTSDGTTVTINGSAGPVTVAPGTAVTLAAASTNSGSVTITATSPDGASANVTITVIP